MFNFDKNIYLSKELMEEEDLSIRAKCIFAYIENVCAKTNKKYALLYQKELMEVLKIKSRTTLREVLKELESKDYIKVKGNKYTIPKSYIKEVI